MHHAECKCREAAAATPNSTSYCLALGCCIHTLGAAGGAGGVQEQRHIVGARPVQLGLLRRGRYVRVARLGTQRSGARACNGQAEL
jgi:hypothetical protein